MALYHTNFLMVYVGMPLMVSRSQEFFLINLNLRHNKPQMSEDDQKFLENHISTQVKKAYEAQRNLLEGQALPQHHEQVLAKWRPRGANKTKAIQAKAIQAKAIIIVKLQEVKSNFNS